MTRGIRVDVGVGVIVRRGGDILLMRRKGSHGSGNWSTPGGHLDPGETFEECAAREARVNADSEVSYVGWFPLDGLPEPLFLPLRNLIAGRCDPEDGRL